MIGDLKSSEREVTKSVVTGDVPQGTRSSSRTRWASPKGSPTGGRRVGSRPDCREGPVVRDLPMMRLGGTRRFLDEVLSDEKVEQANHADDSFLESGRFV